MAQRPSIHISIFAGSPTPAVFSTALSPAEQRALDAWLAENPDLAQLVDEAWKLADAEPEPAT